MSILAPRSLAELHRDLADQPGAHLVAGGTDLMVEVNYGHRRPETVISLRRVDELKTWEVSGDRMRIGAGVTWTQLMKSAAATLQPALAQAARTVGSPQIRNAGTLGGNVGTASPAGDGLPVLYALNSNVVLGSVRGRRSVPIADFISGPKRTQIEPDEVIEELDLPILNGKQHFSKIGARNAMVISVAGLALVIDNDARSVRCALGSVGPTILRATAAEEMVSAAIDWADGPAIGNAEDIVSFGELVAQAARPIDDHRSTARYRRHAVGVMARRALMRCL
jgi:CO/xanthine dehydrogenase FAD-binding subunit